MRFHLLRLEKIGRRIQRSATVVLACAIVAHGSYSYAQSGGAGGGAGGSGGAGAGVGSGGAASSGSGSGASSGAGAGTGSGATSGSSGGSSVGSTSSPGSAANGSPGTASGSPAPASGTSNSVGSNGAVPAAPSTTSAVFGPAAGPADNTSTPTSVPTSNSSVGNGPNNNAAAPQNSNIPTQTSANPLNDPNRLTSGGASPSGNGSAGAAANSLPSSQSSLGTNAGGTGPNTFQNRTGGSAGSNMSLPQRATSQSTGPALNVAGGNGPGAKLNPNAATTSADPLMNDYLQASTLGLTVAEKNGDGLSVLTTIQGGVAQQAGIVIADQILSINRIKLRNAREMAIAVKEATESGQPATLSLRRGGENHVIHVDLTKPSPKQAPPSTGSPQGVSLPNTQQAVPTGTQAAPKR